MKKFLSGMLAVCLAAGTAGTLSVYAEDESYIDGASYSSTMPLSETSGGQGGWDALSNARNEPDSAQDQWSAAFFNIKEMSPGEDYFEIDLPQVHEVTAVKFRSRGCIQRLKTARIDYLDNADGIWKTAVDSAECSEYHEGDYKLFWKSVDLPAAVHTARIRVYPLTCDGEIRLDALYAMGTPVDEKMYGNQLYDSTVTLDANNQWLPGWGGSETIDGKYKHANETVITMQGKSERKAEVTYILPEERTMNYIEITSYYKGHSFTNGSVSVWNKEKQSFEQVAQFEPEKYVVDGTNKRVYAEFARTVTTDQVKISIDDGSKSGDLALSEVFACEKVYNKLDSLYFTTYDLEMPNADAGRNLSRLHEDGDRDLNPGDEGYGNDYDSCIFVNPQGAKQPATDEDYVEMRFASPSDVKEIVLKTVAPNAGESPVYSKPTEVSVYYLDHETQKWIYGGCLNIPAEEYVSSLLMAKSVYADAVRLYVTKIAEPANYFRLAGFYAIGETRNKSKLNNGNLIGDVWTDVFHLPSFHDGKLDDGKYVVDYEQDLVLYASLTGYASVNQVEFVWRNTLCVPETISVDLYQGDDLGWSNGVAVGSLTTVDVEQNAVRQTITLPKTYDRVIYMNFHLNNIPAGQLCISEIIARNAEKTGYTVQNAELAQYGSYCNLKTEAENFEGEQKKFDVYYAAYQNGQLVEVQKDVLDLKPFSKRTRTAEFDFSDLTGEVQIKRYVWTEAQNPYTDQTVVDTIELSNE